jgi:hypothetical protein
LLNFAEVGGMLKILQSRDDEFGRLSLLTPRGIDGKIAQPSLRHAMSRLFAKTNSSRAKSARVEVEVIVAHTLSAGVKRLGKIFCCDGCVEPRRSRSWLRIMDAPKESEKKFFFSIC